MRRIFIAIILFFFPTPIARLILKLFCISNCNISSTTKIGFSILLCDEIELINNVEIGHLNIIRLNKICIEDGKIKHLNYIKGYMNFRIDKEAWINSQNKISSPLSKSYKIPLFWMKSKSVIIMNHLFDVTDDIILDEESLFAGAGSQVWTHHFILGSKRNVKIEGAVHIGKKCYIGSRCVICTGVTIGDKTVIGANTTVSKSIKDSGLYVNQALRYIPYNADDVINKLENPVYDNFIYNRKMKN